jgi:hypothetical protein
MTMPPGPFSPAAVEQICRVLGDAVTGSEIPNLIAPLNAPEAPGEETKHQVETAFQRRGHSAEPPARWAATRAAHPRRHEPCALLVAGAV